MQFDQQHRRSHKTKPFIIAALILTSIIGLIFIEYSVRSSRFLGDLSTDRSESGQLLPISTQLRNFETQKVVTFEQYRGKVTLINFWASWCQACIAEMPSIARLYKTLKPKGLEVISINVDENPQAVVPALVKRLDLNFPIFTDVTGVLSQTFDVVAIPFSIISGRDLRVVWTESGERDWASEAIIAKLTKLLGPS